MSTLGTTLEQELGQAAEDADNTARSYRMLGKTGRDIVKAIIFETRAAALRARAARVRELEADLKKRAQHGKRWSRQCAVHDRALIAALSGPLNPDSAGGTR